MRVAGYVGVGFVGVVCVVVLCVNSTHIVRKFSDSPCVNSKRPDSILTGSF